MASDFDSKLLIKASPTKPDKHPYFLMEIKHLNDETKVLFSLVTDHPSQIGGFVEIGIGELHPFELPETEPNPETGCKLFDCSSNNFSTRDDVLQELGLSPDSITEGINLLEDLKFEIMQALETTPDSSTLNLGVLLQANEFNSLYFPYTGEMKPPSVKFKSGHIVKNSIEDYEKTMNTIRGIMTNKDGSSTIIRDSLTEPKKERK